MRKSRGFPRRRLTSPISRGLILRGYRIPMVLHFLTVGTPAQARELLGRLVSGNEADAPQVTIVEDWHVRFELGPGNNPADLPRRKPEYCLNGGFTWQGLVALGVKEHVPTLSFKSFNAFVAGAAERTKLVGDSSASDSRHWIGGFGNVALRCRKIAMMAFTSWFGVSESDTPRQLRPNRRERHISYLSRKRAGFC